MEKITIKQVMDFAPCYSREKILQMSGGRKSMTALEICDLPNVSTEDKLWLLLRPEIIPDTQLHILACHWAEQALLHEREAGREPDERSWKAIDVKRRWIAGKATKDELSAAGDAAGESARAAARAAGAAGEAARAAWAVAWAAGAAAWAAGEAALAAELQGVRVMLKWLEENKK